MFLETVDNNKTKTKTNKQKRHYQLGQNVRFSRILTSLFVSSPPVLCKLRQNITDHYP